MRTRALDANDDMTFGLKANGWLVDSPQAVGVLVKAALRLWRGEWFLDTSRGLPVLQSILTYGVTEENIADILRGEVLKVTGVVSVPVVRVTLDRVNRKARADIEVVTAYGRTKVNYESR